MDNKRFSHVEFIASGGFAKVYRAFDHRTRRWVAVKELSNPNPDSLRRFVRERDMLTVHRNNPFVLDMFDSDLSHPEPYLVLEYAELGSLQKYVASRRDWRRIAGWLLHIAYGLTLIHERGDLIRDIKPSNLLRFQSPDGGELVKIADFGLGQRADNPWEMMTTSVFGTKGYIDPIAQATGSFAAPSDIYALGIAMRELLTGSRSVRNKVPGPAEFQSVIGSMTDLNVANRPTAREIFEQVKTILATPLVPKMEPQKNEGLRWLVAGAVLVAGTWLLADGN